MHLKHIQDMYGSSVSSNLIICDSKFDSHLLLDYERTAQ